MNGNMQCPSLDSSSGHSLGSLLMNNLPSAVDMLQNDPSSSSFVYTRNEAFEDLLEVLRNNGGEGEPVVNPGRNRLFL